MLRNAQRPPAVLFLEDGTLFHGQAFGKSGETGGELCFNTGMTGYQEIYTDPSYFGQIVIHTMPHIGNYGVVAGEVESDAVKVAGVVCSEFSEIYSRTGAEGSLETYLFENGIVGITGVDTRALVLHIRHRGAMNGIIAPADWQKEQLLDRVKGVPSMESRELASQVMRKQAFLSGPEDGKKVAVLDFGVKENMIRLLGEHGFRCLVLPGNTRLESILEWEPDGFFLSNGPGDPASMAAEVATIQTLIQTGKPVFGICLGHQLLARAHGIATYKMKNGHRGLNHPVQNLRTGRSEITSQNHGFAVDRPALEAHPDLELTHLNLNDGTVEGLQHRSGRVFSVQFHPESSPGPHDSRYLFGQFQGLFS